MKYGIYSVHDTVNGYLSAMVDSNDPSAIRNFSLAINTAGSLYNHKPSDFSLFKLGVFDTASGIIEAFVAPEFVIDGLSLIQKEV